MEKKNIKAIMEQNSENIAKLHEIVKQTMDEESLMVDRLVNPPKEVLSQGQRISDKVARFGGSWTFIILFAVVLIIWILYNSTLPTKDQFDPYPFILMNLVLSCVAAMQAPIIMMSQNRQEEKDRMRAENDYLVNLKAELEIRSLHQKMDMLLEEQVKDLFQSQEDQYKLIKSLNHKIDALEKQITSYKDQQK
ncbi:DUF1003 domain-containing protein [Sphingobacterium sp. DK4209]|uniref:DUF1003 domain-containing protein n=1 Tax=Sphingobacterium zhuxiongii TaxID=2662364 RepID=A0A5Q0QB82_9SPHI|nr:MULTISPECIES: DUF1003 domain-containing protein [unclassified Sphingobacterium]MVZ67233.1 DUF1003 domain-containing protein [Sphingobacterium sp. DK4209]QGA26736.1 DUF1003 domain-containing protein [Sphingobacterium sp. dk4302]